MDRLLTWRDHILNIKFNKPDLEPEIIFMGDHVMIIMTRHLTNGVAQLKRIVMWEEVLYADIDLIRWHLDKAVEEIMLTKPTKLVGIDGGKK